MIHQGNLLFFPLENYRGFTLSLEHFEDIYYHLVARNPRDFTQITSQPRTFTLLQVSCAIAYGKELIDQDLDFSLFKRQEPRHYFNECKSNLAALDSEYTYDF
jgi:hypothetical protein